MNTKFSTDSTLFQDRDLSHSTNLRKMPARFSTEPEGEGAEIGLRVLLVGCLLTALMSCGMHLNQVAKASPLPSALPDAHAAVCVVQPGTAPAAKAL